MNGLLPNATQAIGQTSPDPMNSIWYRFVTSLYRASNFGGKIMAVGSVVLVAGTKTVLNVNAKAGNQYFLTRKVPGGTAGMLSVGTIIEGASFIIDSDNAADTGTISYMIVQPL